MKTRDAISQNSAQARAFPAAALGSRGARASEAAALFAARAEFTPHAEWAIIRFALMQQDNEAQPSQVICRGGEKVDVDVAAVPSSSPLHHMICGHHGLAASSTLDVDCTILKLIVIWLTSTQHEACAAAQNLPEQKIDEAIEWSDYLVVSSPSGLSLRQHLQRRVLKGRIRQAEETRRLGKTDFDALETLTTFARSDRQLTILKGLSPPEIKGACDAAILLNLKTFQLGSEFPRALVVARQHVRVDLKALANEHAPHTARSSKHGSGGRRRRQGANGSV